MTINSEAEFIAAPIGTVMQDRNRDVFVKATERGARQDGVIGLWGPTWVAYPAEILKQVCENARSTEDE